MSQDPLDYSILLQDALRGLVRRSLEIVAEDGLPGDHHFYLSFRTDAPGVVMPPHLRERYPEEMTIVLKTQFLDLDVTDEAFSVGLYFNGSLHYLAVPLDALLAFTDPSVDFQVAFQPMPQEANEESTAELDMAEDAAPVDESEVDNVVSFSGFRKKQDT